MSDMLNRLYVSEMKRKNIIINFNNVNFITLVRVRYFSWYIF